MIPATFAVARARYDALQSRAAIASRALASVPGIGSGPMGLTPDNVRATRAYQLAKADYDAAANEARRFAIAYCKAFKLELANERRQARAAGFLSPDRWRAAGCPSLPA